MVVAAGVAGAGMMSQEMMRTATRMRRKRTIVRGCGVIFWATCRPGKPSTVALNCLTETMWARCCRPGMYPIRAFSFDVSRATCRPGNLSPATNRPGFPGYVAGENGKCCSDCWFEKQCVREMDRILLGLGESHVELEPWTADAKDGLPEGILMVACMMVLGENSQTFDNDCKKLDTSCTPKKRIKPKRLPPFDLLFAMNVSARRP
nr:hypothetical protein [Tanacetum cinerariifolium]